MRRHHEAAALPAGRDGHLRAIIERADQAPFRQGQPLIGRQVQAGLDTWLIKDSIVFASHDEWKPEEVGQDCSGSIQTIKPQQCACLWQLVRSQVRLDGFHRSAQLLAVFAIPRIAKRSKPLVRVGLQNGRPGTHDFPSFATSRAWSTHLI